MIDRLIRAAARLISDARDNRAAFRRIDAIRVRLGGVGAR